MRGITTEAKARNVSRITGVEILVHYDADGRPTAFDAWRDPETHVAIEYIVGKAKAAPETALRKLHSAIYHANGEIAFARQGGKCCFCGKQLSPNAYEKDHKEGRGAHGRNDRPENIQVCCTGFDGCDGHRRKHGN
jgi:hypothetical protein